MKGDAMTRNIVIALASIGAGLTAFGVIYGVKTRIAQVHTLKQGARAAYLSADYRKALSSLQYLVDSLAFSDDAATLDLAHAGFLSSRFDSAKVARDRAKGGYPLDSNAVNEMKKGLQKTNSLETYQHLSEMATKNTFASTAYNQLGVIAYNLRSAAKEPEAMNEAVQDFKSALKKDPANDFARYNYELIRKRIDYPEMIMSKVRSLIHQRKYKEARTVLKKALEKDNQMKMNFADYVQRLENIINIDSLARS
jgi:tetratricopeptide (TPR) repeat protein